MMSKQNKSENNVKTPPKRVIISGGGTGGHIFPAISIANALKERYPGVEILFVGALGRMEMERVPAAGYRIEGLPVAGFDRRRLWRNFGVLLKLYKSMRKARRIVAEFRPQIAIGVGGYASGPTLKAAQRKGVPTLIQEQNSYAGVTNKLLAAKARRICVAYPGMERFFPAGAIVMTGNPIRAALLGCSLTQAQAKEKLGFDPAKPLVLVVGGSLGARTINQSMEASVRELTADGLQLLWQTGKNYTTPESLPKGVITMPFVADMATAYRAADIVVSRAGAGSISELQALGKATVLVPSPNVAEDHQRKNAMALVEQDAAIMIPDDRCAAELPRQIAALAADAALRQKLQQNIARMALTHSAERIVDEVEEIINHKCI